MRTLRLDFSRTSFVEMVIHLAIAGVAASLSGASYPEILGDAPEQADSVRIA